MHLSPPQWLAPVSQQPIYLAVALSNAHIRSLFFFFLTLTLLQVNRVRYIPLGTTSVIRTVLKNTPCAARGVLTAVVPLTINTPPKRVRLDRFTLTSSSFPFFFQLPWSAHLPFTPCI